MSGQCGSKSLRSWLDCWWAGPLHFIGSQMPWHVVFFSWHTPFTREYLLSSSLGHRLPTHSPCFYFISSTHSVLCSASHLPASRILWLSPGWLVFGKDFVLFLLPLEWRFWRGPSKSHQPCSSNKPPLECEEWGTPSAQQRHWVCRPWTLHFQNW